MVRLYDSELKLMELLWQSEPASAKELSMRAAQSVGWNKNTTYTVLKKLIEKSAVKREEPGFVCTSLVQKADVRKAETDSLIDKLYGGSRRAFFSAFLEDERLSAQEIAEIKAMIEKR
jgi:Predicted transcriptional regulator